MLRNKTVTVIALTMLVLMGAVGSTSAQRVATYDEFFTRFTDAQAGDDFTMMKSLVAENALHSVSYSVSLERDYCEGKAANDTAKVEKVLGIYEQLAIVFKLEHKSRRLVERKKWLEGLDEAKRKTRLEYMPIFLESGTIFQKAEAEGSDEAWRAVMTKIGKGLVLAQKAGDETFAAYACKDLVPASLKVGDKFASVYYARLGQRAAARVELTRDFPYFPTTISEALEKHKIRAALINPDLDLEAARTAYQKEVDKALDNVEVGGDDGGKGNRRTGRVVAKLPPRPTSEAAYEFVDDEDFKAAKKALAVGTKIFLPYYRSDVGPGRPFPDPFDSAIVLKKGDKDVEVPFAPGATASYDGKLTIDPDGPDGKKKSKPYKLKIKMAAQKIDVEYDTGVKNRLHVFMRKGPSNDKINGTPFRFEGNDLLLYYRGASSVVGEVRGHPLTLIDCDGNGTFDDAGSDAVMVGTGKNAVISPVGRYLFLPEETGLYPYEFKITSGDGSAVRTRPFKGELAPLTVRYGGKLKPKYLVVKGSGEDAAFFFDAMQAVDQPMWIPSGFYSVHGGYVLSGRSLPKARAVLIGKGRAARLQIESGKLNVWEFGGAGAKGFRMEGEVRRGESASEVIVSGNKTLVFGNMGEQYFNFEDNLLLPDVTIRKGSPTGSKLTTKSLRMPADAQNVVESFYPDDLTIKKLSRGKLFYKLSTKHPVLGKMESEWTEIPE